MRSSRRANDLKGEYLSLWPAELRQLPKQLRHRSILPQAQQLDATNYPRPERIPEPGSATSTRWLGEPACRPLGAGWAA